MALLRLRHPRQCARRWRLNYAVAEIQSPVVDHRPQARRQTNFREQHWEGTFWEYLDIVTENPAVARNAFQRVYDMILSLRLGDVHAVQAGVHPLQVLRRPDRPRRRRDLRARAAADAARRLLQVGRAGVRHREAHPAAARPGRLAQEHDRAAAEEGAGVLLARPTPGKCYTYAWRLPHARRGGDEGEQYLDCPMHEEPLLLIPREARSEVLDAINEKLPEGRQDPALRRRLPVLPQDLRRPAGHVRRRLEEGDGAREGASG